MALNYSHWPTFTAHRPGDNLMSPLRIVNGYLVEGVHENNGEGYARPWHATRKETQEWDFSCRTDRVDDCCSPESISKDIADLLPSDPFGMDIKSTFTAITGWLEDLEVGYAGYVSGNNGMTSQDNNDLFAGCNLIWNNALNFQPFHDNMQFSEELNIAVQSFPNSPWVHEEPHEGIHVCGSSVQFDEKLDMASRLNQYGEERDIRGALAPFDFGFEPACSKQDELGFSNESTSCSSKLQLGEKVEGAANSEEVPHEAFVLALSYLGVKDLLSVERVSRSLCSMVRDDTLLWTRIHIDQPLNERITDDILLQLASRAQGNLQCLSLVECPKITDDCVRRILETNPRLTKLFVSGCTRLTIEGILDNIRTHNSNKDVPGIKHLRIGGLYGVTHKQFEELKLLLGADGQKLEIYHKPHFYHRGNFYLPYDDDRALDIEMCPRCEKFRLVYDCPAEGCQVKDKAYQVCRGCALCIPRCAQCGRCINDNEYEETFCLDLLCSDCFKQMLRYQDGVDKEVDSCEALHEPSYNLSCHE
ncbi:hypothetical protein CDL12_00859 [Handroanthus impetiginosus]|uniref:F-box domain-containing protein n=1 Tax=Handroanthus impetiginosus TaxID=429701 RepID=A0A2G9I9S8_9LAMI|nr:hypothetical protein CDL12_00859 [Handroanthus impetiginosus]